ncbi:MAG: hypothetical protein ACRCU9_14565 [Iodobacter sp.]
MREFYRIHRINHQQDPASAKKNTALSQWTQGGAFIGDDNAKPPAFALSAAALPKIVCPAIVGCTPSANIDRIHQINHQQDPVLAKKNTALSQWTQGGAFIGDDNAKPPAFALSAAVLAKKTPP